MIDRREMADIRGQGELNRDEFAVAMKLIVDKTQHGKEIPRTLPASMIPPSLRGPQPAGAPGQSFLSMLLDILLTSRSSSTAT